MTADSDKCYSFIFMITGLFDLEGCWRRRQWRGKFIVPILYETIYRRIQIQCKNKRKNRRLYHKRLSYHVDEFK